MKVLVFSDTHSNIYALKKLINSQDFKTANLKICLGDNIMMGPRPNEVLEILTKMDCVTLIGNNDGYIANQISIKDLNSLSAERKEHINYVKNILKPEYLQWLQKLPYEYVLTTKKHKLYFTHYIWKNKFTIKDCGYPICEKSIIEDFKNINCDYVFYGHQHKPYKFINGKHYYGIGSIGMIYPGNYAVINIDDDGEVDVEYKTLNYNFDLMKNDMINQNYVCSKLFLTFFDN